MLAHSISVNFVVLSLKIFFLSLGIWMANILDCFGIRTLL